MPESGAIADEPTTVPIVSSEVVYSGRIYDVVSEVFEYNGEELTREFVRHPGAVAVLALDEVDRVLAIKQYRHPVRAREWEIPAGLLDVTGEPLLDAAKRELAEEVDIEADSWSILADIRTSPGGSDEFIRIYLARELRATSVAFAREAEEADIEIRWLPLDEVLSAIAAGAVTNAIFVTAALAAHASRADRWANLRRVES